MASRKTLGYTDSSERLSHSVLRGNNLSIIRLIWGLETSSPYISDKCLLVTSYFKLIAYSAKTLLFGDSLSTSCRFFSISGSKLLSLFRGVSKSETPFYPSVLPQVAPLLLALEYHPFSSMIGLTLIWLMLLILIH